MKKTIGLLILLLAINIGFAERGYSMASLVVQSVSQNSITLAITGLEHPDSSYSFEFSMYSETVTQSSSTKTWSVSCGTTNYFSARAMYKGVWYDVGGFYQASSPCPVETPTPPAVANAVMLNDTMAQISWSGGSPENYNAEVYRVSDGAIAYSYSGTVKQLSTSNLLELTTYKLRVRTRVYDGGSWIYSAWTYSANFTTGGDIPIPTPNPITSISVTNVGETSASVNWNGGNNLIYFIVKIYEGSTVVKQEQTSYKTHTFTGLTPGTTYTATVYGCERTNNCCSVVTSSPFTTSSTAQMWDWSIPIDTGSEVYNTVKNGTTIYAYLIPATEWNAFMTKINQLRVSKGYANYSFTVATSGMDFTHNIMNEPIQALNQIGNLIPLASIGDVKAQHFKDIRDYYNYAITH